MKVLFGISIAAARGRLNGTVWGANQFGPWIKAFRMPTIAKTELQSQRQAAYSQAAQAWHQQVLSAQRKTWRAYAQTLRFSSSLGTPYVPGALAAFLRTNILKQIAGMPIQPSAPEVFGHAEKTGFDAAEITVNKANNRFEIAEAAFPNWDKTTDDDVLFFKASVQQRQSTIAPRKQMRIHLIITGDAGAPPGFPQLSPYQYGTLTSPGRVFFEIVRLDPEGRVSKAEVGDNNIP